MVAVQPHQETLLIVKTPGRRPVYDRTAQVGGADNCRHDMTKVVERFDYMNIKRVIS